MAGELTLLQLVNRVRREAGVPGAALASVSQAVGDSARIVGWVADCWKDVQLLPYNWRWMRGAASGQFPAGVSARSLDELLGTPGNRFSRWLAPSRHYAPVATDPASGSSWRQSWLPFELFRDRFVAVSSQAGPPQFWTSGLDGRLLIGPTPDKAYTVAADYFMSPQELAGDGDSPDMPGEFHSMLVWRALAEYGAYDAAPEVISRAADRAETMLTALITAQGEQITFDFDPLA
ncbi:MAG: hypothetical protein HY856_13630 [Burkholderiales bacterium]|nr:hypothetical protein [Burkholderiales bacterium]